MENKLTVVSLSLSSSRAGSISSGRPSEIVEKIIQKISSQEKTLKKQFTQMSLFSSHWGSASTCGSLAAAGSAAAAGTGTASPLQMLALQESRPPAVAAPRYNFARVVDHAQLHQRRPGLKGAGAFKAAAFSVLSPANRRFIETQAAEAERPQEDRKIILGGETFKVNEDLKVITEEDEESAVGAADEVSSSVGSGVVIRKRSSRPPPLSLSRRPPSLSNIPKRESTMSINSSCSVDSEWSDDELEELERILGDIQDRSDAVENEQRRRDEEEDPLERSARAMERWAKLKRSRNLAMNKIKYSKKLAGSTESIQEEETEDDGKSLDQVC